MSRLTNSPKNALTDVKLAAAVLGQIYYSLYDEIAQRVISVEALPEGVTSKGKVAPDSIQEGAAL